MKRDSFGSKLGALAATAGASIGLGNIWKFPYITGENGGAAFILVYLICIIIIGLPVTLSEFAIGRKTQSNVVGAYKKLAPSKHWRLAGILAVLAAFVILSFYLIIAGWVFAYLGMSATGKMLTIAPSQLSEFFVSYSSQSVMPLICNLIVVALTAFIVISGVRDGVEKYSKILMPILLGLLVVLMLRSLTLTGAHKGIEFLFKPDFSKLKAKGVLEALGHVFYSLSLGMGIVVTFGSYVNKKDNLFNLAINVTIMDTVIALMAGIVIFPAVFAYGFKPESGPSLIFETLPAVFDAMPLGAVFETLFFLLIGIAAITSTTALLEVVVAFFTEQLHWKRKKATIIVAAATFLLSIPSTFSFGIWKDVKMFGKTFYDILDFFASYICLPVSGLLICIFVTKVWGTKNAIKEITSDGTYSFKSSGVYNFLIKYVAPIAIVAVFLYSTGIIKF